MSITTPMIESAYNGTVKNTLLPAHKIVEEKICMWQQMIVPLVCTSVITINQIQKIPVKKQKRDVTVS